MRKGQRGKKIGPSSSRAALSPKDRLRQQAYSLRNARNFAQAKPLLEELYKLEPDNVPLALDLGEAYMETEDFGSATSLYAKLIEKDPKNINAVTNLGGSLIRQGKLSDARSILEYALQLDPKSIHARINLGSVLQASGERKANLDNALEAVQIDPSSSLAFNNLGSAFSDMAMFKEARHAYETAVMLDPNQVDALINLAAVEARLGDSKASAEMYERVLKLLPKEAEQRAEAVKFYAAFEYLKQGVLEKGWDYYEGGFSPLVPAKGARTPRRNFDVPRWDGQPLNGKTLLVWREQGLGDELLFATCLHELEALGGNIIVECDARLVNVFQRSFPQYTIRAETFMPNHGMKSPFSDFDLHLPMGSLMKHFRRDIKDFERSGAYVKPDPVKVAKFQERLAPYKDDYRLVGICWRSGKLDPVRNLSYTTLDEWGEVLQTPGFKFVNLQYGECEAELKEAEEKHGIEVIRWSDLNLRNDLDDTFALIHCLDAVASVQTAVLVMAGSVGAPTVGLKVGGWTRLGKRDGPWLGRAITALNPSHDLAKKLQKFLGPCLRDLKQLFRTKFTNLNSVVETQKESLDLKQHLNLVHKRFRCYEQTTVIPILFEKLSRRFYDQSSRSSLQYDQIILESELANRREVFVNLLWFRVKISGGTYVELERDQKDLLRLFEPRNAIEIKMKVRMYACCMPISETTLLIEDLYERFTPEVVKGLYSEAAECYANQEDYDCALELYMKDCERGRFEAPYISGFLHSCAYSQGCKFLLEVVRQSWLIGDQQENIALAALISLALAQNSISDELRSYESQASTKSKLTLGARARYRACEFLGIEDSEEYAFKIREVEAEPIKLAIIEASLLTGTKKISQIHKIITELPLSTTSLHPTGKIVMLFANNIKHLARSVVSRAYSERLNSARQNTISSYNLFTFLNLVEGNGDLSLEGVTRDDREIKRFRRGWSFDYLKGQAQFSTRKSS